MPSNFWLDLMILLVVGYFVYSRFFGTKIPKGKDSDAKDIYQAMGAARKKQDKARDIPAADAPEKAKPQPLKKTKIDPEKIAKLDGVAKIKAVDSRFDEAEFIGGAKQAYGIYYAALSSGDEDTLESLVAPKIFDELADQIDEGKNPKVVIEEEPKAEITNTRIHGRSLMIETTYTAKLTIDGKKTQTVKEIWTWGRSADDEDPNWELESQQKPKK